MSTFTAQNKTTSTFTAGDKSFSQTIFFVSDSGDFYLMGSSEADFLIASDSISWTSYNKN